MNTKKEYTAPSLQVMVIAVQQMLANSVTLEQVDGEFNGEFYSREFDFDDDEESEWLIDFGE